MLTVLGTVADAADLRGRGKAKVFFIEKELFDIGLVIVGEFETIFVEEFYTVVFGGIVRSADNRAAVKFIAGGYAADSRRRYNA